MKTISTSGFALIFTLYSTRNQFYHHQVNVEMAIEDRKHDAMLVEKVQKDIRFVHLFLNKIEPLYKDAA